MNTPVWTKPALIGAAAGAVALAVVGFAWGGWVTDGAADQRAARLAQSEVVAALVPFCVQKAKIDPQYDKTVTRMKEARSYARTEIVMQAGWATMPGDDSPDRYLASACLDKLGISF